MHQLAPRRPAPQHGLGQIGCGNAHWRKTVPLRELHFGELDASLEAVDSPELLTEGFYDYREAAYGIAARKVWVLLGAKGAGRSAVLEHLKLEWANREDRFFDYWDVRTFPVNDVTRIQTGQTAGAARAQSGWEFLLLLRIIASLDADQALDAPGPFGALRGTLREAGVIGADYKAKVAEWSKWSVKVDLKMLQVGTERSEETAATPLEISAALRRAIATATTPNQHVIALDGLDSFFFDSEDEWVSLAGLMSAERPGSPGSCNGWEGS